VSSKERETPPGRNAAKRGKPCLPCKRTAVSSKKGRNHALQMENAREQQCLW